MRTCALLASISLFIGSVSSALASDFAHDEAQVSDNSFSSSLIDEWMSYFKGNDEFQWHGHISQGFAYSENNNYFGDSEDGSFKFRELSFGGSWRPTSALQLTAQGIYREAGEIAPTGIELDFAILDYRIVDTFDYSLGGRAGRLKNPYGFFNETRDITSTRPGILLPQSIYIDYLREFLHSADGIGFYGRKETLYGSWSFDLVYGKIIETSNTATSLFATANDGSLNDENVFVGRLQFQSASGLWRVALSHADLNTDVDPGSTPILANGSATARQWLLSGEVFYDNWELIGEYQIRKVISRGLTAPLGIPTITEDGFSFYLHLAYNIDSQWKMYISRDTVYRNKDDKEGSTLPPRLRDIDGFAKDTAIGLRYRPNQKWTLGAEIHDIDGTYWLPDDDNPDVANQSRDWKLYLLQASYEF